MSKFKIGQKYKSKCLQRGKTNGMIVARMEQELTCIYDDRTDGKRLAYYTKQGTEISWHVSQYDRKNFTVSK